MATKTVKTRIQQKVDTEEHWLASSLVLNPGEVGFASDTKRTKIGNGKDVWEDLPDMSTTVTIKRWVNG